MNWGSREECHCPITVWEGKNIWPRWYTKKVLDTLSNYQTVLGQWHSSLDAQFIWISPWVGWKAFYVETLYSEFVSAKFDTVSRTFFVYNLDQKLFPSQTVLGQWHSSLDLKFIWISPWLGWKAISVETLYNEFLRAKFDNVSSTFLVYHPGQKSFPLRLYSDSDTPHKTLNSFEKVLD